MGHVVHLFTDTQNALTGLHPPTEKRITDSCSLPSVCIATRSVVSASRTYHLTDRQTNSDHWEAPFTKPLEVMRHRSVYRCCFVIGYLKSHTYFPECVPMATTAPLGWKSAQCPCSWGRDNTVNHISTIHKPSTRPAVCWPPACDSTADCDPQSSRDRPDGPEHMSETCPWTGERPNPTAHLCDPEHITNSTQCSNTSPSGGKLPYVPTTSQQHH